jgi:Right handed beta helix region/Protein of unknown function (DUF1565)
MREGLQTVRPLILAVLITIAILITGILSPSAAEGATYYVSTSGNDANSGTQTSPFQTIAKGLSVIKVGDTLYIRGGTYAETIDSNRQTIPTGTSYTAGGVVTIAAYPGETVTLRPSRCGNIVNLAHAYIQYIIFDRLVLDAINCDFGLGTFSTTHHIRVQNCEFKNAAYNNVNVGRDAHHYEFLKVVSHDAGYRISGGSGGNQGYGLYIEGSDNLVDGGSFYGNSGYNIHLYSGYTQVPNRNVIRNVVSYNCCSLGPSQAGILLAKGDANMAYNNIIYGNPNGLEVGYGASNSKVYNNTIYSHTNNGISVRASTEVNTIIKNNILFKNPTSINNAGTSTILSNNLVATDPMFVDAPTGNFHLQVGSPAIDAGTTLSDLRLDKDGVARPQGRAYDIGAYEFTLSLQPPTNLRVFSQ